MELKHMFDMRYINFTKGFNRTFMELKPNYTEVCKKLVNRFNRTFMELKLTITKQKTGV